MGFMLRLKNIQFQNNVAEADFYPENSKEAGHIVVNLETKEVISCEEVPGFGESYRGHAKWHLIRMANEGATAKEQTVMWY